MAHAASNFSLKIMSSISRLLIVSVFLALSGCMSVPPEVVQLSALTAADTQTLHDGYRSLVRKHFAALRKLREQEFADQVLYPYIEDAIKEGRLVEVVQGKVVWDNDQEEFVAPDPKKATVQKLDTLNTWNRQVAIEIEELRRDAFADLDKLEGETLDKVDAAFGNVIRGGTTIHAYLVSLQKVESEQNEFLKGIGLGDFPKKLNETLERASTEAAKWSAKAEDADKKANSLKNRIGKGKGN